MEKFLKILIINHGKILGGAQVSLRNALSSFVAEDEIKIINFYQEANEYFDDRIQKEVTKPILLELGRAVIGWSDVWNPRTYVRILRDIFFKREILDIYDKNIDDYDLVYFNSSVLIWLLIILKLRHPQKKMVFHIRETSKYTILLPFQMVSRWLALKLCDGVVAVTEYDKKSFWPGNKKIRVIRNGASQDGENCLKVIDATSRKIDVLSLGGWIPRKGGVQILRIAKYLPNLRFCIAGCDNIISPKRPSRLLKVLFLLEDLLILFRLKRTYLWHYQARIACELLDVKNVDQIGFVNPSEYISSTKLLLFGGVMPHASRPIFEAWLRKVPVAAFQNPALQGDLVHNTNGIELRLANPRINASMIENLLKDPDRCKRLGLAGFQKATREYDTYKNSKEFRNYLGVGL